MLDYRRRGSGDVKQTQFTNLLDFPLITGWQIPSVFFFFPRKLLPTGPDIDRARDSDTKFCGNDRVARNCNKDELLKFSFERRFRF